MEAASQILGTVWEETGVLAPGVSEGTWKRFLAGKVPINAEAFKAYCQVLELDWTAIAELDPELDPESVTELEPSQANPSSRTTNPDNSTNVVYLRNHASPTYATSPPDPLVEANFLKQRAVAALPTRQDWSNAPDVSIFYGRQAELETVQRWMTEDRCRLLTLLGMGGIGKTALSVKLVRQIVAQQKQRTAGDQPFTYVIWRSLRNAPAVDEMLADLIQFLSDQQVTDLPADADGRLALLLQYLRTNRCLIMLDNAESILKGGDRMGRYRVGYEGYEALLRCVAETSHQSCLVITSREKPKGLTAFEGETLPVRSLQLSGLLEVDGRELFNVKGSFTATDAEWQTLIERYAGNPLALKIVASSIHDFFDSSVSQFLAISQQSAFLFDDIRDLLDQHFQRLTILEKSVMYWLAINREPTSISDLQADFLINVSSRDLLESLNSLQRRSLVDKGAAGMTQQPVVMEYVINQLVERISHEITEQTVDLFKSHALTKAQAKEYVRETQLNLIVQPIMDQLLNQLGSKAAIATALQAILAQLRGKTLQETGYAGGNALNLLLQLGVDLTGYDFSRLTVWQAYLQDVKLHDIDFTGSDLSNCVFTESLGNVLWATFSPEGERLATCDTDCQVRVWDVQTGQLMLICRGHANWVRHVTFSPDGRMIASCGADQTVRLWNAQDGVCIKTLAGHDHEVFAVAFSPDGQLLASAGGDCTIKLWDVQDGQCIQTLAGHADWVRTVVFAPYPSQNAAQNPQLLLLASGGADQQIKLWDVATGECLQTLSGHQGWVRSLTFSRDGQLLASGSGDQQIKLWDCSTGDCLSTYDGHSSGVYCVIFSPTTDILISSSGDRTVKLWDWRTDTCLKTLSGQSNEVCSIDIHPDGRRLVCVSLDQTVKLWDCQTGQCLRTWDGHTDWALPVAFSPDGQTLASGSNDKSVVLWNWRTGQQQMALQGHTDFVYAVAFSADGQILASGSTDLTVRLWRTDTGQCVQVLQGHTDWINAIAFHPREFILATASADDTVKLWNCQTGQCLRTLTGHVGKLLGVSFSPDGSLLASCGIDQTVKLWATDTGECLNTLQGHASRVWSVAFSPDGKLLSSSSTDQTIRLWSVKTGKCCKILTGHTNWVFALAFSPDGQTLASASHDQTVRVWETKTGTCLYVCTDHAHLVSSIAFSPDGSAIASGSQDQTVRIWDAASGECLRVLIAKRLYEGMKITGVTGLTSATITTLQMLGAVVK